MTTGASIDPASVHAGANTRVVRYVPHAAILPSASLVITHAGLGTTMAALGRGVPLLCTPMGRDQFFNAEQVQALGAGRMLMPDSSSDAIAQAATDILGDDHFKAGAKRMAIAIGGYGGAAQAAAALEALAAPAVAVTPAAWRNRPRCPRTWAAERGRSDAGREAARGVQAVKTANSGGGGGGRCRPHPR